MQLYLCLKKKHLWFKRNENNLILNTFARDYDFNDTYLGSKFHYDADLLYDLIKADIVGMEWGKEPKMISSAEFEIYRYKTLVKRRIK